MLRVTNTLLVILSASSVSLNAIAAEPPCSNPVDTVKQVSPQNAATIAHYFWESGRDRRSNGYLKTLRMSFKNGDYVVIQHKYCAVYHFEVAYFRSGQGDGLDAAAISKIVTDLYEKYAAKKAKFSRPLPDIISASLKEWRFDGKKDISIGLPEENAEYRNERVEYAVSYTSLYGDSSIYSSVVTFYVGIGGLA